MNRLINRRLGLELGAIAVSRTVVTTFYRMMYPFLPIIARGLGVSMGTVAIALAARSILAFVIPFFGILSDWWGRKKTILLAQGLFVLGIVVILIHPTFPFFVVGILLTSVAKFMFDSSSQAYAGDSVPYTHRGLALAVVEGSWSGAFLLGVPLVGWLMSEGDWLLPFPWLAATGLVTIVLVQWIVLEPESVGRNDKAIVGVRSVIQIPSALAMMLTMFLLHAGVQQLYISYGVLLEETFYVQVTVLGSVSAAFGLAELGGQGLVAAITDRLGKWRAVMIGLVVTAIGSISIPLFTGSLIGVVAILFILFLSFEFTVVSGLALMSELAPEARGRVMATNLAVIEIANGLGLLAGALIINLGILGVSIGSTILLSLAALSLFRGVRRD